MIPFEITDFVNAPTRLEFQTSGTGSYIKKFNNKIEIRAGHAPTGVSTFARENIN